MGVTIRAKRHRESRGAARKRHALAQRRSRLRVLYGITLEEYAAILDAQGGVCFGCQQPPTRGTVLHVDHDHADAERRVRGLLCVADNTRLAVWESPPPAWVARYLANPPARAVLAAMRKNGVGQSPTTDVRILEAPKWENKNGAQ